jgi:hypothetical protein
VAALMGAGSYPLALHSYMDTDVSKRFGTPEQSVQNGLFSPGFNRLGLNYRLIIGLWAFHWYFQ